MSEEEIINVLKGLSLGDYDWYLECEKYKGHNEEIAFIANKAIRGILDLYNKEKEKKKYYEELFKQNKNREKIKTCMTHNMPNNAEIICMIREDFERNFGNDYISKDKIREIINLTTQNKEIVKLPNNEIICVSDCYELLNYLQELLEEGDK